MEMGGFANQMVHVDLTAGDIDVREIPEDWARKYIGARGLGVRYVFENGPKSTPLARQYSVLHEWPADGHGRQHERPYGRRHQVAADRTPSPTAIRAAGRPRGCAGPASTV